MAFPLSPSVCDETGTSSDNRTGAVNTAQTGGILTKEVAYAIFAEERFPEVVTENPKKRTVFTLLGNALAMMRFVIFG